jgi:hypothetical protein
MAGADAARLELLEAHARTEAGSSKWLAAALGGVGALLLGGLQLANLGGLEGFDRIAASVLAGLVATLGVVGAIIVTVGAMMPISLTFADLEHADSDDGRRTKALRDWIGKNRRRLLRGDERVADLSADYERALAEVNTRYAAWYADPDNPEKEMRAKAAGEWRLYLNGLISELVAEAKLHMTRRAVRRSRWAVMGASVAVAAGIVVLILATTEPEAPALDLRGADMTGLKLGNVELRGVNLSGMTIKNADLTGADLRDATIDGTTWVNTICPDGVNSDNAGKTCAGHLTP